MLTFFLIIGLIISLGFNIATFIIIRNSLKKINAYESWIANYESWMNEIKKNVAETLAMMRDIDKQNTFTSSFTSSGKGEFESDDQVGSVFKELLNLIEKLNDRTQ